MIGRAARAWWVAAALAVLRRPGLWWTALVAGSGLLATDWWRRWPPVPRAPAAWLAFRMETAYGDERARPEPDDVVAWLEWCRAMRRQRTAVR